MGAGQIGGIATLLDIDFQNAAGFQGAQADVSEGQSVVYYLSHALLFCVGALIEAHVVLTPAICVFGERNKFHVFGGTHKFLEYAGVHRVVEHVGIHKAYNHSRRWVDCVSANLALLVLNKQFVFHEREPGADFAVNRLRYGPVEKPEPLEGQELFADPSKRCKFFGWGSRRNGFLIPLLINLRRVDITLFPSERCLDLWNYGDNFLCTQQFSCKSEKYGALCPDDLGTVIECNGYAVGIMISRMVDRPCGVGFLNLAKFSKFLTCGVDDARDVIQHEDYSSYDMSTFVTPPTPSVVTLPSSAEASE